MHLFDLCLIYPLNPPTYSRSEKCKEAFLFLSLPQYLIPAPYYRAKQGYQSPSRKEALTACFGCGPSYEFLIGMLALHSEVKVKAVPKESLTQNTQNQPKHPQHTASISYNFFIYVLFLFKSAV